MLLDWLKATGRVYALFLGVFALASAAQAGPEDGRIVNGSGSISQSGTHTDIHQNSDFLATHWGSFNIAANESVQAHQPGSTSRLLIRVDGGGATNIAGSYTSNGITILENRNGVQFSRGAIVNVGGLLATSSRISGVASANWQLNGTGGEVVNHGQIVAGAGGAILAAVKVQNTGDITAKGGDVALGAGSSFTVDFAGSMVGFEITKAASGASITNSGKIKAQGGIVSLSAQEAQAVRTNVVSVGGVVKATRIERRGGVVYLSGGTQGIAEVSGDVSASKKVQTTGKYVVVKEGALLKAPEILVGGDFQGGGDVPTSRRTLVERGALLNAGKDGRVIVWSDETTWFNGNISAPGGFAEVSGKQTLASVNLAGIDVGELLLDPQDIFIEETGLDTLNGNIAAGDPPSSLTLDVDDINGFAPDLSIASSNSLRLNAVINKAAGNLTLITPGILTLGGNITTAGDLTLDGGAINLPTNGNAITLTGRAVTLLVGAVAGNQAANDNDFTITASGNITISNNINLDTGTLTLTAGNGGTGNIVSGAGTQTLTASTVSLTQDSAFGSSAPFRFAAGTLNLTTGAAQTVQGWMTDGNRALSLTSGGMLTINSNIDTGTGNLTLTLGASQATLTGVSMLSGNVVTFNGDGTGVRITAGGDLTISARGNLRVNTGIAVGANTLRLLAGRNEAVGQTGVISFANTSVALSASRFVFTQDGARFADGRPADFRDGDGTGLTTAQSEPITRIIYDGTGVAQTGVDWANIFPSTVSRGPGGTGDYAVPAVDFVSGVLAAAVSITLDAGTGVLTFAATGDITLSAPAITITAGTINLGTRTLTLTAPTGTLTLNFTAATTITGTGMAGLTVIAEDITFSGTAPILNVPTVSLELTIASTVDSGGRVLVPGSSFGATAPFAANSMIGTLNINTQAEQEYHSWMAATNRNLSIDARFRITIGVAEINLGNGDLTLSSPEIDYTHASGLTIRVGDFSHSGTFQTRFADFISTPLLVFANGNITLETIFSLSDRLELRADADGDGMGMITSSSSFRLDAGSLLLQHAGVFAADLFTTASRVSGAVTLRVTGAGVDQTIHGWMTNFRGTDFSLAGEGAVLNSITTAAAIDFGTTAIDLQATAITLGGDLTAGAVALRADTITGGSANLTITATTGGITATDITATGAAGTGRPALDSTVTALTLTQNSEFTARPFTFGAALASLTLQTAATAAQTVRGWMIASGRDLSLTSTGGDITIDRDINVGTGNNLTLRASGNILAGTPRPVLIADTVNFELTGTGAFTSRLFDRTSRITTLTITTAAPATAGLEYRDWMAAVGRNLTITSALIRIGSTAINLGTGNLTFNSAFGIRLADAAGLTITAGNVTFPVGSLRTSEGVDVSQLVVIATGDIVISDIDLEMARVELRADNGNITINPGTSGTPGIEVDVLLMRQMGMFADNFISSRNSDIRELILRTTTAVDQPIYDWMRGAIGDPNNNGTRDGTRFSLRGSGEVLTSITTTAARDFGATRVDLRATAITLGGALTAGAVDLRTNTITGDSANLVAIHAMTGDITTTRINTSTGAEATGLPTLAAGVRAFSLTRTSTFEGRDSVPFAFVNSVITALTLSTRSEQIVRGWMIASGRNLTITSSGRVIVDAAIGPLEGSRNIGAGNLSLTSTGEGIVRILANISTTGNITLSSGTGGINFNGRAAKTLSGGTITLSGNARSDRRLTINATTGALTLSGGINLTGTRVLSLSSMSDEITLGGALTLTGGSIMFGNAVITGAANLTITTDTLTLNNDITLTGTSILDLESRQGAITGMGTLTLSATTTVRLRQADVFSSAAPFDLSGIGSLELVTTATVNQDVLNWMIEPNRNLTVTSARNVFVRSAIGAGLDARDLGTGSLTLISERRVRILADIATTGNIILTGVASETQPAIRFENGTRVVMGGSVRLNGSAGVLTSGSSVTLNATATNGILTLNGNVNTRFTAADGTNTFGDLTLTGATIQIGLTFGTPANTRILLRGQNIMLTSPTLSPPSTSGILLGRFTRGGDFRPNNDVANLTVNAQGTSTIAADITVADGTRSGGDIALTGGSIAFGDAARTIIGRAIRLRGAATGTADLTITASGTLTIENDIGIGANALTLTSGVGAISNGGATGDNRPTLTAGTVSLAQVDEFAATRLFTFAAAIGSLEFETTVNQDVLSWMIFENTNLTVESSARVRVTAAIGSGGRNLGDGDLTLRSTGGNIRIQENISTMGDIILSGGAGGINFNGREAKTLSGGNVTLSGNARSDRRLTINATSGVLTLSGAINTSTSALSLSGSGGITLGGALTLTGGAITLTGAATGAANLTITTSGALTLNSNITLTGTSILDLESGQGAITGSAILLAPTVRLRQVDVFGLAAPFGFGTTPSLELITEAAQVVHNWMIVASGRNLTVTSAGSVRVEAAIGPLETGRNLGGGNLTLTSGGRVRILADITTTGNIILTGVASATQPAIRFENGARMVMGGNIRLNGPAGVLTSATSSASGGDVTLNATATNGILTLNGNVNTRFTAAAGTTSFGDLTLTGATIQIGLAFGTPANTRILLRGQNIMLTSANGIEIGRFIGRGDFRPNNDVANLTVNAQGTSTIAGNITVDGTARSGGNIELRGRSGTPIVFTDARTIIGRAIRLRGAATGAADLTITASGTLTIENDINIGANTLTLTSGAGAISNGGAAPDARPTLTASTVSLAQVDAFAATRLFTFAAAIDSLVLITTVNQDVLSWMIFENTNLTVTSSARVRVTAAIGSGGRNLGDGDLTLTSTGGTVRIMADITTMGDLTLNDFTGLEGVTGDINFNGGARILNGAAITLTGAARNNNNDLTITATGVLTINNNINIGTGTLDLTGTSLTFGSSVALTAGSHSFTPNRTCNTGTSPSCNR